MDLNTFLAFLLVSAAFIAIPGPNILLIISTSLSAGRLRGLQTVAGVSLAMVLQLIVAALGTSWFLSLLSDGLTWLKWAGVVYLAWLGGGAIYRLLRGITIPTPSATSSFQRGFWVSLTNPKTILFFSAFLPQFVTSTGHYLIQLGLLSVTFLVLALLIDSSYAVLSAKLRWLLRRHNIDRIQNGISGTLYLAASGILAGTTRT